jgi:hypothetical protein
LESYQINIALDLILQYAFNMAILKNFPQINVCCSNQMLCPKLVLMGISILDEQDRIIELLLKLGVKINIRHSKINK